MGGIKKVSKTGENASELRSIDCDSLDDSRLEVNETYVKQWWPSNWYGGTDRNDAPDRLPVFRGLEQSGQKTRFFYPSAQIDSERTFDRSMSGLREPRFLTTQEPGN